MRLLTRRNESLNNVAATSGEANAAEVRDQVAKQMTPADISEAQKLAREWMAKHQAQ